MRTRVHSPERLKAERIALTVCSLVLGTLGGFLFAYSPAADAQYIISGMPGASGTLGGGGGGGGCNPQNASCPQVVTPFIDAGTMTVNGLAMAQQLKLNNAPNLAGDYPLLVSADTSAGRGILITADAGEQGAGIAVVIAEGATATNTINSYSDTHNGTATTLNLNASTVQVQANAGTLNAGDCSLQAVSSNFTMNCGAFGANIRLIPSSVISLEGTIEGSLGGAAVAVQSAGVTIGTTAISNNGNNLTLTPNTGGSVVVALGSETLSANSSQIAETFPDSGLILKGDCYHNTAIGGGGLGCVDVLVSPSQAVSNANTMFTFGISNVQNTSVTSVANTVDVFDTNGDGHVASLDAFHIYSGNNTPYNNLINASIGSFNANFGTVTASSCAGSELAGNCAFHVAGGSQSSIASGATFATVTFATGYSTSNYEVQSSVMYGDGGTSGGVFASVTGGTTWNLLAANAYTPTNSTTYQIHWISIGDPAR